jgi:CDP-paratose 2-epimerase
MISAIVTGHFGLVGSYVSESLANAGYNVIGIDCDIRPKLFADVSPLSHDDIRFRNDLAGVTTWHNIDIRSTSDVIKIISDISEKSDLKIVVHCAAQPSHDWAARDPMMDMEINVKGTLSICEALRLLGSKALLVHLSTNKVYGDLPNYLPLVENEFRYELIPSHKYYDGIDPSMSIDQSKHSLFGCSKAAADLYVQEYSRYFGLNALVLRAGCLTGGRHRGAKLHGFLNYLVKSAVQRNVYEIIGYKGKQVRDNLHARDIGALVVKAASLIEDGNNFVFPLVANLGGGRSNSISILESAILLQKNFDLELLTEYNDSPRLGDHQWYISDNQLLKQTFSWEPTTTLCEIFDEILSFGQQ